MYSTPVVQVVYYNPAWAVKIEDESVLRSEHSSRDSAEKAGRDLATFNRTELVVHDCSGKVDHREPYQGSSSI